MKGEELLERGAANERLVSEVIAKLVDGAVAANERQSWPPGRYWRRAGGRRKPRVTERH